MVSLQPQTGAAEQPATIPAWLEHDGVVYRPPDPEAGEHDALASLQARIWSDDMATPGHQLIAAHSCGGLVIGAFADGRPVGFSYAFAAHDSGRVWLHSHQTGVDGCCRGRRVGATLKWLQRALALQAGYGLITWTFDPLRAGNANFNFRRLGVTARHYKTDYYGPMRDPLNVDTATDRLWVEWRLVSPRVSAQFSAYHRASGVRWPLLGGPEADGHAADVAAAQPEPGAILDVLTTEPVRPGLRVPTAAPRLDADAPVLRIEIPADLAAVRAECGMAEITAWRMTVRQAFLAAFARGYVATGFTSAPTSQGRRCWYLLSRSDGQGLPRRPGMER